MTLTDFLLARIAEDEERFRRVGDSLHWEGCGHFRYLHEGGMPCTCGFPERFAADCEAKRRIVERASRPVYTFSPAEPPSPFAELTFSGGRVYADPYREVDVTEAYQQEVAAHSEPVDPATLRDLAAIYADHPDYRSEWKP